MPEPVVSANGSKTAQGPIAERPGPAELMAPAGAATADEKVILQVKDLRKDFVIRSGFLNTRKLPVHAVDGVSFDIHQGETLGLVGESGSGKSTTARLVLRLLPATGGTVQLDGTDITGLDGAAMRKQRVEMQAVFQDITGALNAGMTVAEIVGEPLKLHQHLSKKDRRRESAAMLDQVGLRRDYLDRYPYELSGGQKQRVGIARALVLRPKLVVLDEPVSALDVSTQSQVINLLEDLQDEIGSAYLFIAHNLFVVHHISKRIAVMYLGKIVEIGDASQVYASPRHPYTQALLSGIPHPNPARERKRQRIVLRGDVPGPSSIPGGCSFHTRCPHVMEICRTVTPPLAEMPGGGAVACHLHANGPALGGASVNSLPLPPPDATQPSSESASA
ncbi:MAG: transporter ATP-binding protein [Actinomycetia bacterium]|nr:transporter ATP-binding protein [Actinomycetes bacterium]